MNLIEMTKGTFENRFFNFMKTVGIKKVKVHYSGGGDDGGVDSIEFVYAEDCNLNEKEKNIIYNRTSEKFEEELGSPVYSRHGSFADGGGFHVNGTVIWDSTSKTVSIEGTEHYYEYDDDGEEINSSDVDWEDVIYNEQDEDPRIISYDVLCFYASNFLKEDLSEEINNRILMAAANGDEDAKEFLNRK